MSSYSDDQREWLETDGLGGFASGTVCGVRTRRYHSLLAVATAPPTGRCVLVNGVEAWVTTPGGRFPLTSHRYAADGQDGVLFPSGATHIESFSTVPWPTWVYRLPDGTRVRHEITLCNGSPLVALSWTPLEQTAGVSLMVRPLLSGRDYHSMHHENPAFRHDVGVARDRVSWNPYPGVPGVIAVASGGYRHAPEWYRRFMYAQERERGFDCTEDLASPGEFRFDLSTRPAALVLAADGVGASTLHADADALCADIRRREGARRVQLGAPLERAADAYIVQRGVGKTIIAGYPWFADWGRDTFIALRGLCLATGRLDAARSILLGWAGAVSGGQLPNRFPDRGDEPEYNSVDASLWYVVAVHEFLEASRDLPELVSDADRRTLEDAVNEILIGYTTGTRHGIRLDADGLLAAGRHGVQLTWMDARVGERVITPRIGKPVEVQALWLNALHLASSACECWGPTYRKGLASFRKRFTNASGYLNDVVDVNHVRGSVDETFRPNQVFAIGGLPLCLLERTQARRVVDKVEDRLLTPLGLRSLDRNDPAYSGRYEGSPSQRDAVYHQGTVWPFLMGAFVEAWVRVRGGSAAAKRTARRKFLTPLMAHLDEGGLGHVSEIADGDAPHTPRGCPFQAWSLGELIRLDRVVLADGQRSHVVARRALARATA